MLNNACAYLWAFPLVGAQTKQESISPQPGCLFSQNCRNLIPLETSVPQSDLPRIDQQIQRSPGSKKHECTNLISFGNWGGGNKAFLAQFPIRTYWCCFLRPIYIWREKEEQLQKIKPLMCLSWPFLAIAEKNRKCDFISNMQAVVICRYLHRALSLMESEKVF